MNVINVLLALVSTCRLLLFLLFKEFVVSSEYVTRFEHMQVRVYDLASMSCSYVLAGHTENVVCLDTCISSSGRTFIATGSRDKSVSSVLLVCP